ncbi:MAG: hypothetical protein MUF50_01520 [Planctomycetes bacterium]|jgi:hypothetical protein|nr:hypothetical protein [Planctomycetota bacterium]
MTLTILTLIITYLITALIGAFSLWIITKIFSADPLGFVPCLVIAGIIQLISAIGIPFLPLIILFIILVKTDAFNGIAAYFAVGLFGAIQFFLFSMIALMIEGLLK